MAGSNTGVARSPPCTSATDRFPFLVCSNQTVLREFGRAIMGKSAEGFSSCAGPNLEDIEVGESREGRNSQLAYISPKYTFGQGPRVGLKLNRECCSWKRNCSYTLEQTYDIGEFLYSSSAATLVHEENLAHPLIINRENTVSVF